ncbi:unnamed protein product [marine sediment metagenome]|uniref:KTSC domain-containing protein n=1 Tax=marine sediment metagenome TaxID=412755 RepID=X1JCS6_9ZZZZ
MKPITKIINGRKYHLEHSVDSKIVAKSYVDIIRSHGYSARYFRNPNGYYSVYQGPKLKR